MAPLKIPWDLIRRLITETYGGKVDDEGDFRALSSLVNRVMTPDAFENEHVLVDGNANHRDGANSEAGDALRVPAGTSMGEFMAWINRMPEREPPTYLGLPADAERLLLVGHGKSTIRNVAKITEILEESEQVMSEDQHEDPA